MLLIETNQQEKNMKILRKAKKKEKTLGKAKKNPKHFMLQLRVIRAFKSTLEDLEDKRSIHSLRSLRNAREAPALSSYFSNKGFLKGQQTSPQKQTSGNISIAVPATFHTEPLNINSADINARYMDDDGPPSLDERSSANSQSKETRI